MAKSPPVHEVRIGLIKASIWQNRTKHGERFSVTVSRIYRNGDHWVESSRFGENADLLALAKVVDLAHTWLCDQKMKEQ